MECNEREAETIVDQQKLLLYFLFYQQTGVCVYVRLAVGVCVGVRERVCVNIFFQCHGGYSTDGCGGWHGRIGRC